MFFRSSEPLTRSQKRLYAGWGAAWLLTLAYVAAFTLWPGATSTIVRCPLHELTGLHCPSCGLSRAMAALLAGDFSGAASLNMLVFPAAFLGVAFPLVCASDLLAGTRILTSLFKRA